MDLDLRINGRLTVEQAKEISELEPVIRQEYNKYIGELIARNNLIGLSLLLQVTCRNTHLSIILDFLCRLRLLEIYLEKGIPVEKILVDDHRQKIIYERVLKKHSGNTKIWVDGSSRYKIFILFQNIIKSVWLILNLIIWPTVIRGKKTPVGSIIYLDNFIFIDSFDSNHNLRDRYYPGLIDSINRSSIKDKIWYIPTLIGITLPQHYYSLFRNIRKSTENILMKEDWLKLSDYLKIFFFSLVLPGKVKIIPFFSGIDIKEIIIGEVKRDRASTALIYSLIQYYFIRRLKRENINLDLVIDWNENQTIDRALNLAIKKYYSDITVKGYQGFIVPDFYTCKDPTCYELELDTVPDELCVVGKAFIESKKKNCTKLNVSEAPAFRFMGIYDVNYTWSSENKNILIVLPISISESKEILALCKEVSDLLDKSYIFTVKQHPSYTKSYFSNIAPEMKLDCFVYSSDDIYTEMGSCRILISASSSVCVEASVLGIPVAIIGSRNGPVKNPVSGISSLNSYSVCYTATDIISLLDSNDKYSKCSDLNVYFEPTTIDSVLKFLSY